MSRLIAKNHGFAQVFQKLDPTVGSYAEKGKTISVILLNFASCFM